MDELSKKEEWKRFKARQMTDEELETFDRRPPGYFGDEARASRLIASIAPDEDEIFDHETLVGYVKGTLDAETVSEIDRIRTLHHDLNQRISSMEKIKREVDASLALQGDGTVKKVRSRLPWLWFNTIGWVSSIVVAVLALSNSRSRIPQGPPRAGPGTVAMVSRQELFSVQQKDRQELEATKLEADSALNRMSGQLKEEDRKFQRWLTASKVKTMPAATSNLSARPDKSGNNFSLARAERDGDTLYVPTKDGYLTMHVAPPAVVAMLNGKVRFPSTAGELKALSSAAGATSAEPLAPSGTAIADERPRFTWKRTNSNGEPAHAEIRTEKGRHLFDTDESGEIPPDGKLTPGQTYEWSVFTSRGEISPTVKFRELDEVSASDAKRIRANSSLGHLEKAAAFLKLDLLDDAAGEVKEYRSSNYRLAKKLLAAFEVERSKLSNR